MFMEGAPSQLDLFDYSPAVELNMQPCPEEMIKGERFAFIKGVPKILGTPHKFTRHGQWRHGAFRVAAQFGHCRG